MVALLLTVGLRDPVMDDTSVLAMDLDERDDGLAGLSDAVGSPSTLPVPIESKMSGGRSATSDQMDRVSQFATFAGHPCDLDPSTYSLFISGATNGLKKGGAADIARTLWMHKSDISHLLYSARTMSWDLTHTSHTFNSFEGASDRMNWYGEAFPAGSGRL